MTKKRPSQNKSSSGKGKQKTSNNRVGTEFKGKEKIDAVSPKEIEEVIEAQNVVDFSGLSVTQKKNLKRRLKKKNMDTDQSKQTGNKNVARKPLAKKEIEEMLPEDPQSKRRSDFLSKANSRLRSLVDLSTLPIEEVSNRKGEQDRVMSELLSDITSMLTEESSNLKKPPKHLTVSTICEQLKDFEIASEQQGEEFDKEFQMHLKELLVVASLYENYRNFQNQCNELRAKIEKKMEVNKSLLQVAQDNNKQKRLVNRVRNLKHDNTISSESIESKSFELPNNRGNLIDALFGSGVKMAKNLEKKHGALVEKGAGNSVQITGRPQDIEDCWSSIKRLDLSSHETVSLDPRVIKKLYSMNSNINLKSLQEELSVIITRTDNSISVSGSPDSTKKVVEIINNNSGISNNTVSISLSLIIAKALQFNFLPTVRAIEKETETSIRIQFGSKSREMTSLSSISESQPDSKILIFGKHDNCELAKGKLTKLIKTFAVENINVDNKVIRKLFSPQGKDSSPEDQGSLKVSRSVIDEFSRIRDSNKMGVIRIGSSVVLVGPATEIKKTKPILLGLFERAQYVSMAKTINKEQLRILNHARREEIEKMTSVEISTQKKQDNKSVVLEIMGSEEAKANAEKMIDDIINKEAYLEVIDIDSRTFEKLFTGNQRSHLRKITSDYPNVQVISGDRKSSISILGPKNDVLELREKFVEFNKNTLENSPNETEEIVHIPNGKMGLVIGSKGSVLNEIISKSSCESVDIPRNSNRVVLRGTREQCTIAKNLINEILNNSSSNSNTTTSSDHSDRMSTKNSKVVHEKAINFDEKCFPALGGAMVNS
ncbi:KH domain [Cryptosporidium ryanae]|uniref:KH domain n=1 Tax=Cryptosporidium ryanae TaxID=515981 RepID=UPI00351A673D|nr:KH domain [Cryptosporidium ryanae]